MQKKVKIRLPVALKDGSYSLRQDEKISSKYKGIGTHVYESKHISLRNFLNKNISYFSETRKNRRKEGTAEAFSPFSYLNFSMTCM